MLGDWIGRAACRDEPKATFYGHEDGSRGLSLQAIRLCAACPVSPDCLDYAMKFEDHGYWGGTTAKKRREARERLGTRVQRPQWRNYQESNTDEHLRPELHLEPKPDADN